MPRSRSTLRAIVVLAVTSIGLAVVAALWIGRTRVSDPERDQLVAAVGRERLVEGRLAGGFAYARWRQVQRGEAVAPAINPAVRLVTARLRQELERHRPPEALEAFAAGQLLTGEIDEAVHTLKEVIRLQPGRASAWSDLAAADLASASEHPAGRGHALVEGLNAAIAAARLGPTVPEALFNLALLTERLVPTDGARAWQTYLRVDDRSDWAGEARERMARLAAIEQARLRRATPMGQGTVDIADVVRQSPQQARVWAEEQLLPRWAEALRSGRQKDAEDTLATLGGLGDAMRHVTGDPMLADAVAAITRSDAATRVRLSEGHIAYRDARRSYAAERLAEAEHAFARSEEALRGATPFAMWASMQLAVVRFDKRDIAAAEAAAGRVLHAATAAGYTVLTGRSRWIMGLCQHQRNAIDEALLSYAGAIAAFARTGERENELAVMNSAAENLRLRGDRGESWEYLAKALEGSDALLTPRRRYLLFLNAALFAGEQDLNEAALTFYDAAIEATRGEDSPGPRAEGLLYRARHLKTLGRLDRAQHDVLDAQRALSGALDNDPYLIAEIAATRAELLASSDAETAVGELDRAIGFFETAEPARIPRLLLLRGRTHASAGRPDRAVADFDAGIERFESRRRTIGDAGLKVSYADESRDLFDERIAACVRERPTGDCAFGYAERASARTLIDRRGITALEASGEAAAALPPNTSILRLWVGRDRVFVWLIARGAARFEAVPIDAARLGRLVEAFRSGVIAGRVDQESGAAGREIYERLVKPFVTDLPRDSTLGIVPDGALSTLPFGALEENGRPLVERFALVEGPSATLLLRQKPGAGPSGDATPATALLVGNPTLDRRLFPRLPSLPDAEREVRDIASVYDRPTILLGAQATRAGFVEAAGRHAVVHFAGHAVANDVYPMFSLLALAADGSGASGALFAKDIADIALPRTRLVVLAACDTAAGQISKGGEGVLSLARPFLAAGVSTVIASLWSVDDRATAALMSRVHRRYAATRDAVRALRDAQLDLAASGDPELRLPGAWAGFVVIGSLNQQVPFAKEQR